MKMTKLKYSWLIGILLAIILIANPGCSLFGVNPSSDGNSSNFSTTSIDPNWTPAYIDEFRDTTPLSPEDFVEKIAPMVVSVLTEKVEYDLFFQPYTQQGAGSGIIIDRQGYVVTNYHVLKEAERVTVTLFNGSSYEGEKWVGDIQTDLAVIKLKNASLPTSCCAHFLRDSLGQMNLLDEVIAVGNALARGNSWTKGVISQLEVPPITEPNGVVLYDLIQTDAAINPGNSGGPLLNAAGQVIGINVAIAEDYENIGFAISTNTAIPVVTNLIKYGSSSRPWLGIRMTTVTPTIKLRYSLSVDQGVFIVEVIENSPADKAGLKANDVIIRFEGEQVDTADDLRLAILEHSPGDSVEIVFVRGTDQLSTTVTLGEMPANL
jgi:serine protease Do